MRSVGKVLKDRLNRKSIKQISAREQLLSIAKEDAAARNERKSVEQFQNYEQRFYELMRQFSMTMSRTMLEGFWMIHQSGQCGPSNFQFAHIYDENWGKNR